MKFSELPNRIDVGVVSTNPLVRLLDAFATCRVLFGIVLYAIRGR